MKNIHLFLTSILMTVSLIFAGGCSKNVVSLPNTESPDFVSFSDKKIPTTWQTTNWVMDTTTGYDDLNSLKATANHVVVVTNKTFDSDINFIEFYLKGNGTVDFYVDGSIRKACPLTDSWVKHGFYFEKGSHTFKWELDGVSANLDAIHFKKETQLAVGTYYRGGIIAYLSNTNQHGIVAAPEDQSTGIQWYNGDYINTGTIGREMGAGKLNTVKIFQIQGTGDYAAKICKDLVLNGYDDWYLPSRDELNLLYQNRNAIGGFMSASVTPSSGYWSSSEDSRTTAWSQRFDTGTQESHYKNSTFDVRAIRTF